MSPVHSLPVELLARVFSLGMPGGVYPEFPPNDEEPFEILVSHVCRHWRNIALNTPALWTTIHFRLVPHMNRAQFYLKRSQRHLINILVDTCALEEHVSGVTLFRQEFMPIFKLVIPHIERWKSLSLKVRDGECKLGARTALSTCGVAPKLEYLQLWHIENWENAERLITQIRPPPVVVFDKSLPSLKHIVLIGVNVPWSQSPFLEDLSTVELGLHSDEVRIPYDVWSRMLSTSPNLYRLSLHYSGPRASTGEWPAAVIHLPGLRELELTDMDPPYALQVLQRLSMPNVTRFQVELHDHEEDFSQLLEYLAEPPAPPVPPGTEEKEAEEEREPEPPRPPVLPILDTFIITALDCTPQSFVKFLQNASSIRSLEMSCNKMADGLFEQLWTEHKRAPATTEAKGKGKGKAEAQPADTASDEHRVVHPTAVPASSAPVVRCTTRASSSDSERSELSADDETLSTAPTSPSSAHSRLDSPPPASQPTNDGVLLPELDTVRISGAESHDLCTFVRFRQRVGRPVRRWIVNEKMRSEELQAIQEQMTQSGGYAQLSWFVPDEDEDDDDEEYDGSEASYVDEEGEHEALGDVPAAAAAGPVGDGDDEDDEQEEEEAYDDDEEADEDG